MTSPLHHPHEPASNDARDLVACNERRALRPYTPSQAVLARSSGTYHWTPEGRRLYDFTSGVLVANLGHNPVAWMQRFMQYMRWADTSWTATKHTFFSALPMNAYNAVTPVETEASRRLIALLQDRP